LGQSPIRHVDGVKPAVFFNILPTFTAWHSPRLLAVRMSHPFNSAAGLMALRRRLRIR
jgi:hypothetical protein